MHMLADGTEKLVTCVVYLPSGTEYRKIPCDDVQAFCVMMAADDIEVDIVV